jgi:hypothetical protein
MKRYLLSLLFSVATIFTFGQVAKTDDHAFRAWLDLKGQWQFSLDSANKGIAEKWFSKALGDQLSLPGTTDLNKKGFLNKDSTTMHYSRVYKYEGPAWYQRKLTIPKNFKNKHIQLFLERTKSTQVWIDETWIGGSSILQSPQEFDLSKYLSPGDHVITIRVDNNLKLTPYGNVHIYSDDAQTNWNGIIGEMFLEASARTYISDLQVFPDIDNKKVDVRLDIPNPDAFKRITVELLLEKTQDGKTVQLKAQRFEQASAGKLALSYSFEEEPQLWDEYNRPLYKLTAVLSAGKVKDAVSAEFGMRQFRTKGTQFSINDRITFLRGKHDAAVFPLTGYPPMDVSGWLKVFNVAKTYGINHYRFHSWSPPKAAFTAADQLGIYLQVELPFWAGLDNDTLASALRAEGMAMLKHFANHPSFVMFSHGNEIWGGHDRVEQNILAFKAYDPRPLYTMGSNVNIGYHPLQKSSDFFVGSRTGSKGDTILTHTRMTHAFADSKQGARLNSLPPSTDFDYSYPVSELKVPIVSHEIGQYQIYPDYREIQKYTGVVEARNLEIFRNRLKKAGMLDQNTAFQQASGMWSALCYKAEMEAAFRTKGFGGFQLLDLQDFTGQGTALVGILDAFMDSKNVISEADWRMSINDVVLLAAFPKYVWTNTEQFKAKIEVANYSNKDLTQAVVWKLMKRDGETLAMSILEGLVVKQGGLTTIKNISIPLASIKQAEQVFLEIAIENSPYKNVYPIWVYPASSPVLQPKDVNVVTKIDGKVFNQLQRGAKILLFPKADDVKNHAVQGLFPPEFWNWGMFKGISENVKKPVSPGTLGLLMNPKHPLFALFPTDSHTNWQWFSIIKASNPLILNKTDHTYRPIVQVIDNLERNDKLGMVFEFKVGKGKLLVCMSQLNLIMDKPEAKQLYNSILHYMNSADFNPAYQATAAELAGLGLK